MKNSWVLAVSASLLAFTAIPAFAAEPSANPGLLASANGVRDAAHARDLRLAKFDVTVRLHGVVAETEVVARFANTGSETLEGNFTLALPKGAVVTGYALDLGGRTVDGVLVDRPKAKAVYEERVRRGVDPGLAEVTTDDVFTTRVFPIPARGGRTIRLRFVAPLGAEGYRLPLHFDAPSEGWTITTQHVGGSGSPDTTSTGQGALDSAVTIRPVTPEPVLASRNRSGETFLQLSGDLPPARATHPERLRVYWDRSRSRRDDRHDAELALLRRVLAELKPAAIEVVTFNSSGAERFDAADADAAVEHLRAVRYRGATSFAALGTESTGADRCLLFSDGRVTIDRDVAFAPRCRLQAITTSATADMAWLRHLATTSGGRAYALAEDGAELAQAIARAQSTVSAVTDDAGNRLAFVPIETDDGHWAAIARAPMDGGVRVTIGGSEQRRSVAASVAFDGDAALLAVDALATLGGTDQRAQFVATSRRYGVASPSLSFVVLETPEDYLAADVAPPATYPAELLTQYRQIAKQGAQDKAEERHERFAEVAGRWDEQVAWWKTSFDPKARPKRESRSEESSGSFDVPPPPPIFSPPPAPSAPMPPPPPPPKMMPPPPPLPPRDIPSPTSTVAQRESDDGDVIVTATRSEPLGGSITVDAWQPDRAYLKVFDSAPAAFDHRFDAEEAKAGGVPAFYLDTAEWLRRHGRLPDAVEMVLAALELPSANEVTLGIVADRLERYGALDRAIELRERQAVLDPDRPQPKRLLALALARRARLQPARARADLTRAVALLGEVALTPFDTKWDGIDVIALTEANAMIPRLRAAGGTVPLGPRFIALLDMDMRVVVDWTTDATDLDLWVDEPSGERAIFSHPRTATGGHLSNDMTDGYGPEEYFLRRAPAGTYVVQANVYAADQIDPNGLSLLTAHLIRDFGRPTERDEAVDVELQRDEDGEKMLGRIAVGAPRK